MKHITRIITAGLSAIALLSCSAIGAGAASVKTPAQVKVITCGNYDCKNVNDLLKKLGCDKGCNTKELLKYLKSGCPRGNCSTQTPSVQTPAKPEAKPAPQEQKPQAQAGEFNTAYESEVLRLVNAERAKYGLSALSMDSGATTAAHIRAKEIVKSFSHTRPDGRSCFTAASDNGVTYRTAGENIAYGYSTPAQVVNGWMNSAGHRKNILSASFSKIGIGCYKSGNVLYWSQFFIG